MDPTMFVGLVASWVTYMFPSLAEYTQFVAPALMVLIGAIGVFTNLLPKPNHAFLVPDTTSLETELQGNANFILKIAKFTRTFTVIVNWFLATAVYSWFYNSTNALSNMLPRFKKNTPAK